MPLGQTHPAGSVRPPAPGSAPGPGCAPQLCLPARGQPAGPSTHGDGHRQPMSFAGAPMGAAYIHAHVFLVCYALFWCTMFISSGRGWPHEGRLHRAAPGGSLTPALGLREPPGLPGERSPSPGRRKAGPSPCRQPPCLLSYLRGRKSPRGSQLRLAGPAAAPR